MATITAVKERINQLNQASFQILCDALLAKEGYPGIVALGTKDGAEKTTPGTPDTYFCLCEGKYVFAEYTTQKNGLVAKIKSDIEKCFEIVPLCQISEIVYCHTSSNIKPEEDRALKAICEEKEIKLNLIGIDLLAEMLMNYPTIVKDYLGICIDSEQIQTADDFVKQYNSNAMAATLDTDFLFREKEIEAIDKAYEKVNVVLLVGSAGTGKTRLAIEYSKLHADKYNEKLLYIHDRSLPIYEDLKLYFEKPGDYFVFVDDANQLSELELIIEYANKSELGYNVHILMSVREYAVAKVKSDINGTIRYAVITVPSFTDEEISKLMEKHYNILNPLYLKRIIQIAEGNARIAMLAGKIACDANRLDAINDVSDLYEDYYGRALRESGIEANEQLLISAGIMAFLIAVHLDHTDAIVPVLEENGLSKIDFEKNVRTLHEYEIVDIYNDKGVRFSEQCMANFVLKYVFIDKRIIKLSSMIEACFSAHRERTVCAVNTLLGVFRNSKVQEYVLDEILKLWRKLKDADSPMFLEYLKAFYPVNELQTLLILQEYIDSVSSVTIKEEDLKAGDGKNYPYITDDIITILGGFSDLENLDSALDLFYHYYLKRPDLYMQFFHASTSFFSINTHSAEYGYRTQVNYFNKIVHCASSGEDIFITTLFLDVAGHFLRLKFQASEGTRNGSGVILYDIPLALSDGAKEYRKIIWDFLLELSVYEQYLPRIKSILSSYGNAILECSKEVIKSEADYICKLSNAILLPDKIEDCLIAQSLQNVFDAAEYQTLALKPFLSSSEYELYQILTGPEWELDISYKEQQERKKELIRSYMMETADRVDTFRKILRLLDDCNAIDDSNSYKMDDGVNIAVQSLLDDREDYMACVEMILALDNIAGIRTLEIVSTLFSLLQPSEICELLANSNRKNRNVWMFSYFHEIPQKYIDQKELDALYNFLEDDSDRDIRSLRDIDFLDKFLSVDNDVILTASKIILKKREYSPFVVVSYFELQFYEDNIQLGEVVQKFIRDIKLLESIYMCIVEYGDHADNHGLFLHEIFSVDKSFVKEYARWFIAQKEDCVSEYDSKAQIFFQEEEYLDILDFIMDEAISSSATPLSDVPRILYPLLSLSNKQYCEKKESWIEHQIENNCTNKTKMGCLFETLAEISIEFAYSFIPLLIACSDDYGVFEAMPLTPHFNLCSGSCIPLYKSWVEQLQKLLQIFNGIKLVRHKDRVQQTIDYYRHQIIETEISDILGN